MSGSVTPPPFSRKINRPPNSSISKESPVHAQQGGYPAQADVGSNCEQYSSAALGSGGQSAAMGANSVAVLDAGTPANSVRNSILARRGVPRAGAYLARARFKLGDDRLGEKRCTAEIPAETAGGRGKFARRDAMRIGASTLQRPWG